ncbi:hypothetical protein MKW94_004891 [Papaver nudicaule]|uniref:Uncharacterized protein n=1 Tax=Papaver nudicaule TaxID=74823 RepID=A0AA41V458_PAPNU|nr:hypothetical protein [Papaver nudicaule]
MEIREKAISILQSYFLDGVIPRNAVSDEDAEENESGYEDEQSRRQDKERALQVWDDAKPASEDIQLTSESSKQKGIYVPKGSSSQPQGSGISQETVSRTEGRRSRSGKKGKKRHAHHKSQQKSDEPSAVEQGSSQREEDTAMSGTDPVLSSSSRFASPDDSRGRKSHVESTPESSSEQRMKLSIRASGNPKDLLKDGYVIALHARDSPALHVSRQRVPGGAWFLDTMSNVTRRDPAAQFLVAFKSKDTIGLRSFAAGGKLLHINRRMEVVFASHSFDVWENWALEGSFLEECRLVNCRNPSRDGFCSFIVTNIRPEVCYLINQLLVLV